MSDEYTFKFEVLTPLLNEVEDLRRSTSMTLIQRLRKVFSKVSTKALIDYAYTPTWILIQLFNGASLHLEMEAKNGDRRASISPAMLVKDYKSIEFTIPFRTIIP
jgi:hypothetical protein